jgi:hypothetical protein
MTLTTEELEKIGDDIIAQMAAEGYAAGAGNDIDRGVAMFVPCPKCKHKGNEYYSFISDKYKTARAFAICKSCGYVGEF